VAGPWTGGQNEAHWPLHLNVVGVSGTNQHKVNSLALVSTVAPPIFAVFSAVPDAAAGAAAAGECPPPDPPDPPELLELPQAAITSTAAASPADASHLSFTVALL